jgi:N-acetyl-anhydromuramyl-L-alanine amidase AmpD
VQQQLVAIGYGVELTGLMDAATRASLRAFQRRFRPQTIDGLIDDETQMLLAAVAKALA